jgi:type VI protein secretion system component Hcp
MPIESDVYVKLGEGTDVGGPLKTPLPLIEGDSTDQYHYYWSELRGTNFGLTVGDPEPNGEGESTEKKPNQHLDRVKLTKKVDWASTQLFLKCCEAAKANIAKSKDDKDKGRIDQVTVEVCRTAAGEKFAFVRIKYYGVRVVDYSIEMSGPEPSESIELEVEKFDFEYIQTDPYTGFKKGDYRRARGIEGTAGQSGAASGGGAASASGGSSASAGGAAGAAGGSTGAGAGAGAGASGDGSSPSPASATDAAVATNFPGLWQGTGFGLLPD